MTDYADLEISLHGHELKGHYRVEPRLRLPGSQDFKEPSGPEELQTTFDLDALATQERDKEYDAYGQTLAECLFAPGPVSIFLAQAWAAAQVKDQSLRLRLRIGRSASELHPLRWELIHDPLQPGRLLATGERIVFSRYLASSDWRPVHIQPQEKMQALVVIANPSDIKEWQDEKGVKLTPVPVAAELARARKSLATIPVTALHSEPDLDSAGKPTLQEMLRHLRNGCDILYLVAHGALSQSGQPMLWLEDDEGKADRIVATDTTTPAGRKKLGFLSQLAGLSRLPRLVILASCESAGDGGEEEEPASRDTRALAALGPRLAGIGVPAVVAMQGSVTMKTVEGFMPVLFTELLRDGHIDRAVASARRAVHGRWDWWLPVLFTRLESGQLFTPEAPEDTDGRSETPEGEGYDLSAVRELLTAGFSARSLPRMLRYSGNRDLRQLVNEFSPSDGLTVIIDTTLDYCENLGLLGELVAEVQRENPRQYARFEPRLRA